MPIYEYQCTKCGEEFTVRQSIGEDGSKLNCPKCHTENPRRVISSFFGKSSGGGDLRRATCSSPST